MQKRDLDRAPAVIDNDGSSSKRLTERVHRPEHHCASSKKPWIKSSVAALGDNASTDAIGWTSQYLQVAAFDRSLESKSLAGRSTRSLGFWKTCSSAKGRSQRAAPTRNAEQYNPLHVNRHRSTLRPRGESMRHLRDASFWIYSIL